MNWPEKRSYIRKVNEDWERFVTTGNSEGLTVRSEVLESWKRSFASGVDPSLKGTRIVLNDEQLQQERLYNQDLIDAASPVIEELGRIVDGSGHVLLLCNPDAVIIDMIGDRNARKNADLYNMRPGGGLSERVHGTNSMGTVVAIRRSVEIFAAEHYLESAKEWACMAAPIMRATNGNIVGILNMSSLYKSLDKHNFSLVVPAARAIEVRLMKLYMQRRDAILMAYSEDLLRYRADLIVAMDAEGGLVAVSSPQHPLLGNQLHDQVIPAARQMVRHILKNPDAACNRRIDSIELLNEVNLTLTYKPVFSNNTFCGVLLYVYGPGRQFGNTQRECVLNDKTHTPVKKNQPMTNSIVRMVGVSPAFNRVIESAERTAATDATVVISGETGVGKELLARMIHQLSNRSKGPFIAINCGALPKELIASELFGYAPGAFTGALPRGNCGKFEAANGGTLLLDEVAELSLEMQTYLLRVLQEKEVVRLGSHQAVNVDVRIIAATHRDLRQCVRQGSFREDLFYRLNVIDIRIPPLRERPEDFPCLIAYLLNQYGVHGVTLREEALRAISAGQWPGNVRELGNVIQRAIVLGQDIETSLLEYVKTPADSLRDCGKPEALPVYEDDRVTQALKIAGGNVTRAARELGVARSTIYRHLKEKKVSINRSLDIHDQQ